MFSNQIMFTSLVKRPLVRLFRLNTTKQSVRKCTFSSKPTFDVTDIKYPTKIPLKPVVSIDSIPTEKVNIDPQTIELLMRLSLVNISDQEALKTLEDSIEFASKIFHVDTTNVEPMYFVHEDQYLALRDDVVTEGNVREDLLANAPINDDICFVAPPGNIPVELEEQEFKTTTKQ